MITIDVDKYCTQSKLKEIEMLRNFRVSCVEVKKSCSGYSGTLPLIFPLRLANKKISW